MPSNSTEIGIIDRYMQAIGEVPLLTAEEELNLAQKIRLGDPVARDQMILANLRLVVKIAYDYANMGVPLIDLISEGNLGLIKSVERFDPQRGGRLATYASWWIRQTIKQALADQSKMMRLPMHMVEKIARLRRAINELTAKLGREPTATELAKATHFSQKRIEQLKDLLNSSVSLEAHTPLSQPLSETLSNEDEQTPLESLLKKTSAARVREMLTNLNPRHATILKMRYGLDNNPPRTLDEIGHALELTRERVRQLEQEAQTQLRRILLTDDKPLSQNEVNHENRTREKIEVLREFMLKKGLLK